MLSAMIRRKFGCDRSVAGGAVQFCTISLAEQLQRIAASARAKAARTARSTLLQMRGAAGLFEMPGREDIFLAGSAKVNCDASHCAKGAAGDRHARWRQAANAGIDDRVGYAVRAIRDDDPAFDFHAADVAH